MFFLGHIRNFYGKFERPISSLSLIAGFVFDIFTLKRVDTIWENLWILGHLVIVGLFITLIHIQESDVGDEENPSKIHFWYVNILQFFFGGILSTYLVFYFRSADIFVTWPFLLILALAFIANESLKRHYIRFSFQISLLFLSIYSFMIFLVPVLIHQIGTYPFIFSGILSLIIILAFTITLFRFIKEKNRRNNNESKKMIFFLIIFIFALVNFLYFTNLIPPIPLSLKDAGVYHSVEKNKDGNYEVSYEKNGWKRYFTLYPNFSVVGDSPIYAFSAVFSPKGLNLKIIHEWQHYDEVSKKWVTKSTITLKVIGGRDNGFRTYSTRSNLAEGKWRVNIKTETNQNMGHIRFNLVPTNTTPPLLILEK